MTFDLALPQLRAGQKMARDAWGTDRWIQLERAPEKPPKLRVVRTGGAVEGLIWAPQQSDLFAEDWFEVRC